MKTSFVYLALISKLGQQVSAAKSSRWTLEPTGNDFETLRLGERSTFELRHVFFPSHHEQSLILEIPKIRPILSELVNGGVRSLPTLMAGSRPILIAKQITRKFSNGRRPHSGGADHEYTNHLPDWATEFTSAPNVTDRETLINLARMTSDAYSIDPSQPDWMNITNGFNSSTGFGWNETGLRGHIFTNLDNSTVIIAFKGTSVDPRDGWARHDKLNDNLLFSCCCATQRPDPYWYGQVCDCRMDTYKCNSTCLTQSLIGNETYYPAALSVYFKVTQLYPTANVWTTGHSMGGAIASLVGLTFNIPAVTFEAPPQALAAERLGLAVYPDPNLHGAYHFGNTGDPVFMGACNGWTSSCAIAGLAFESQCFTGQRCVYDTVADKGWHLSITNHRINYVIPNVLEAYDNVANCSVDDECVDCYEWYFS